MKEQITYEKIKTDLRICRKHLINGDYKGIDEAYISEVYNTLVTAEYALSALILLRDSIKDAAHVIEGENNGT